MQHFAGEGWLGLEKLHQLTKKGMYRLKVLLNEFFDTNYKNFLIELNKMLKVSLTDRNWNDYVGYWNWIKVCTLKLNKIHVPATVFGQVGAGEGYKLTLGHFLSLYSTLGDALSPDPCGTAPRAANQNFSAK